MKSKIIKTLSINLFFLVICFSILGNIYSQFRRSRPIFTVDIEKIEEDIENNKKYSIENTGWPTKSFASKNLENNKYRKLKNKSNPPCLEIYGGSYAYSFNSLTSKESWTSSLEDYINCSVLNYGIPGFGTDQAMIRHEKYKSINNTAILMFVDDSLKRNRLPMLSLSYKGLSKEYDAKTFKPYYVIQKNNLVLKEPNALNVYKAIKSERQNICFGSSSILCIFKETYKDLKKSIKTKGKYYQLTSNISKPFADFLQKKIILKEDPKLENNINLQLRLVKQFFLNCKSIGQKCYVARFPYMEDIAYPNRIKINPIEQAFNKEFNNQYINSYDMSICMRPQLGKSYKDKPIDTSVMRFEHFKNKHYLDEANLAFAKCISKSFNAL